MYTVKKRWATFPPPAEMSLTKLSLGWNNLNIPGQVSDIPAGDENVGNLLLRCTLVPLVDVVERVWVWGVPVAGGHVHGHHQVQTQPALDVVQECRVLQIIKDISQSSLPAVAYIGQCYIFPGSCILYNVLISCRSHSWSFVSWDEILEHQFSKDPCLLLHAIHSPFYWRILKKSYRSLALNIYIQKSGEQENSSLFKNSIL